MSNTEKSRENSQILYVPLDTTLEKPYILQDCICAFTKESNAFDFLSFYPDGQYFIKRFTFENLMKQSMKILLDYTTEEYSICYPV